MNNYFSELLNCYLVNKRGLPENEWASIEHGVVFRSINNVILENVASKLTDPL